jgi:tyrosyl-tRNA synthetase
VSGDSSDADQAALSPEVAAEVERQHAAIMRGTLYGDASTRRTMEAELRDRLAEAIQAGRPLRVYLGVDPTAPDLHLGHCVGLRKLRTFQELGHQAILLIGDFTGLVGDPSDKDSLRPMRTPEELAENSRSYQEQAFKVLDPDATEVRRNSEWLGALNFADVVRLASNFTVAQFIERDTFANRLRRGEPVYVHEFMYGLMQGYDAYALQTDVQIGGTDQTFNLMAGRTLQRAYGQAPQVAVTFPILVGIDGVARMSKSSGNHIGIDDPPNEQYGKAMSIPDDVLGQFFTLGTNISSVDIDAIERARADGSLHPMDAKKRLARAIVTEWHGAQAADAAAAHFDQVFSRREAPDDIPEVALAFSGSDLLIDLFSVVSSAGLVTSRSEFKRLLAQGGVQMDGERVEDAQVTVKPGTVFKIGKRRWLRVGAE